MANNPKIKNLLNELSAQDLEQIQAHDVETKGAFPVDDHWMLLSEFGEAYGWQAYLDAKNDRRDEHGNLIVTVQEFMTLIEAKRKREYLEMYRLAEMVFLASVSARARNPLNLFKSLTKRILKRTEVDE